MANNKRITALVPMKGHSSRVPNKNVRDLCGCPLFYWILDTILAVAEISRVVVETDADHIAADAQANFDVEILRRPPELVGDEVPMNALIEFHMSQLGDDVYLQTHSTNPLLRPDTISSAISAYLEPGDHDSLFTVTPWKTRLFKRGGAALNHNPDELIQTQDLEPVLEENSNLYIFTQESFRKRGHRIGLNPILYEMDDRFEALDIDEEDDFQFAEYLMTRRLSS